MQNNIRNTNLRFNLDKEQQRRAWELEYQRKQEMQRNQPARSKKSSHDMEL